MRSYCESLTEYRRLQTLEVRIGDLLLGNGHPIRVQTMTTTDTMDTAGTVAQAIRCIEAGAELVRITAPSKKEAENLRAIRDELHRRGYRIPLVADIHFTPNAAEIAARIVEKVRINPGNYVDKKKFEFIEYTDADYAEEIDRIRERFTPLVRICREHGTAMRIGTNHGSLSDRIMSRYGDTPMGMVESAMEFLRIARGESYHNIVLSMKSSNPLVMVQAYRLLVRAMDEEFGVCYPLHLGVTEAGDGEDGRIKSAIGIGTLLEDGIGDTIRVSLTEDPEFEIPVCRDIVKRYNERPPAAPLPALPKPAYSPYEYARRRSTAVENIGGGQVPVVVADMRGLARVEPAHLRSIGYAYDEATDKWAIGDAAADYVLTERPLAFALPGTLRNIASSEYWVAGSESCIPMLSPEAYLKGDLRDTRINCISIDAYPNGTSEPTGLLEAVATDPTAVFFVGSGNGNSMHSVRRWLQRLAEAGVANPVVLRVDSRQTTPDGHLIHFATEAGALLLDGMGDGILLSFRSEEGMENPRVQGRTYLPVSDIRQFANNTAFSILQATRTRISKTEYISCPSCGRTLFDLQETTAKIRSVTNHLKGVKIAIMGCIVNGPGEMADADFGYVGSGPGKITLYKGKEVVKKNVDSEVAVEELIRLLKESDAWVDA
jgi:(E)-4-hydroxy-3-methylbut-2-enyl-diphosphate synthase